MSNKYLILITFFVSIHTVVNGFAEDISEVSAEINVSESPDTTKESDNKTESETINDQEDQEEELAILLPDKGVVKQPKPSPKTPVPLPSQNSSEKSITFDKHVLDKHIRNRVVTHMDIDAIYNCTPDSFLSLLVFHTEFDNFFTCNQVLDVPTDIKLNATLRKLYKRSGDQMSTPIVSYDCSVDLIFNKGNNMMFTTGKIDEGMCTGDKITILNIGVAKKGACKLRSGVAQILSEYAMLIVTGKCQSSCFGDVNITVNPGLKS